MGPSMCLRWQEQAGGVACVKQGGCRYAHTAEELVKICAKESRGEVCFLEEARYGAVKQQR